MYHPCTNTTVNRGSVACVADGQNPNVADVSAFAEEPTELIVSMPVNDKDRHVLALAVYCRVSPGM